MNSGKQYILGISAFYHDSAACLLADGEIVAAAQEERFTRKKGDASFPSHAIDYCLGAVGISANDLTHVGFYDKPLLKFERILETYLGVTHRGFRPSSRRLPYGSGTSSTWRSRACHRSRMASNTNCDGEMCQADTGIRGNSYGERL